MASLRFCFDNLLATATLQNGTGGGAPALDELDPWVTSNLLNRDRGLVWAGTATGNVDMTLAAQSDLDVFFAFGHRGLPSSSAGITSIEVFTQAGAYTPGGTWTSRGTITLGDGVRDGVLLATVAGVNSVRYAVTASTAFTLAQAWAGELDVDLGVVSSPGYARRRIIPRFLTRMGPNNPFVTRSGDPRWEYSLPYNDAGATLFGKLLDVGSEGRPFAMLDRDNTPFEVILREGTFAHELLFDAPDRHNATLELETLG